MNNLEKLGGHFLETEVQQWHVLWGGRWLQQWHCSLGKVMSHLALWTTMSSPNTRGDHDVITKHKGGPRCHHQTQRRGGDDEIEKSCLCNPSFQPYSTTKNIKPYARANLNCGPELPSTQTRTTNGNWMQEQLLLNFMRKKSYNSDRTKVPYPTSSTLPLMSSTRPLKYRNWTDWGKGRRPQVSVSERLETGQPENILPGTSVKFTQ